MPPTTRSKRKHQLAELETELRGCARRGDFERLRELVELDRVTVDCRDRDGMTSLISASFGGHAQVVRFLLDNGADLEAASNGGYTAFATALIARNGGIVELLIEYGADVDAQCHVLGSTHSPLGLVIAGGYVDMVTLLLRHGANTKETICDGNSYSALIIACLAVGAPGNTTTGVTDNTPRMEIVQLLLDHDDGVDVNDVSPSSNVQPAITPLCAACVKNSLDLARLLVQNGAKVIFPGSYPLVPSPLKQAAMNGSVQLVRFLLESSSFSTFMENYHRLTTEETGGRHPLTLSLSTALEKNKLDVAQVLVDYGANVNEHSFLWRNAKNGRTTESSLFLLRNGANVNQVDRIAGETPLWAACEQGNAELVQELLKAGADVNIRNGDGEKPIWVAYRKGHKRVVYLLLRTSPTAWPRLRDIY